MASAPAVIKPLASKVSLVFVAPVMAAFAATKSAVLLFAAVPKVLWAKTSVPMTNPKLVLASAAVVAPVPPLFNAIVVPFQTPVVIVPTVVMSVPTNLDEGMDPANLSALILPANFALVILKSATPAFAFCKSTYVFIAFCDGYKISLGLVFPKSVAVLLLVLASAPKVIKAPVAVVVPVPPFIIETTPVTFAAFPVMFPEGVA